MLPTDKWQLGNHIAFTTSIMYACRWIGWIAECGCQRWTDHRAESVPSTEQKESSASPYPSIQFAGAGHWPIESADSCSRTFIFMHLCLLWALPPWSASPTTNKKMLEKWFWHWSSTMHRCINGLFWPRQRRKMIDRSLAVFLHSIIGYTASVIPHPEYTHTHTERYSAIPAEWAPPPTQSEENECFAPSSAGGFLFFVWNDTGN